MPVYEYGCLECDGRFDMLRPMSQDDQGVSCPTCRSQQVQRRLSTFASHTRGGQSEAVSAAPVSSGGGCCGGSCGCGSRN